MPRPQSRMSRRRLLMLSTGAFVAAGIGTGLGVGIAESGVPASKRFSLTTA